MKGRFGFAAAGCVDEGILQSASPVARAFYNENSALIFRRVDI